MRQSNVLAPVIDLKRGSSVDDRQISDTPPHTAAGLKVRVVQVQDELKGRFSYTVAQRTVIECMLTC